VKKTAVLFIVALAMPAAATSPPGPAQQVETITFETSSCVFGACPGYRVTVNSEGSGTFEGGRSGTVTGTHAFQLEPGRYRAFARHLAPLRPARGTVRYTGERCRSMDLDLPSAEVTWRSRRGTQSLFFEFGCDMDRNRAISSRLHRAPSLLPIEDYIRAAR